MEKNNREAVIRITKEFSLDFAHALYGHKGQCRNIHGHTYFIRVTLIGKLTQKPGQSDDGMLIDFSDLKSLMHDAILAEYDHALVLNGNSPHQHLESLNASVEKLIFLDRQPTCENLVMIFAEKIRERLPQDLRLLQLRLQETPSSWAEWHQNDNL